MIRSLCRGVAALALLVCFAPGSRAGFADDERGVKPASAERPVISATRIEQVAEGELVLTGDVELRYGEIRLLADTVHYNDTTHMATAEGNVVLMFGRSQISGDRLEINVETQLATVWNAHGYMDPDVIFHAEKLERIAEDKVVITDGTVTTCTQPTPYWAFHVSGATLHLDHYAYMRNAAFKAGKVPVIYMPYLVWPMKKDRSTGLLLPNLGYSRRRGSFIGNALYVVMGRSQDATFYFDKYGRTGTGLGFEYRFVPAERGEGALTGYYLDDTVTDEAGLEERRKRYRFKFVENQKFGDGYNLLAEINKVSDLDYYLDFERDITQTTSPTVFSHVDVIRNWGNFSLNARTDRQEQFLTTLSDLTLQRLPELELRGRGIRLGRSPFYFSFETSAGLFNKDRRFEVLRDPNGPVDPNNLEAERREITYQRFDLFPTIAASFTPAPWLDVSPSISARETFYTDSALDPADPNTFLSKKNVTREFASFNLSMVGPRFYRLFGDPKSQASSSYKHTFEPHASYSYIPEVSGDEHVIPFDDVDVLPGDIHRVTYGLTSRLFAKRPPRSAPGTAIGTGPEPAYASDITGPTQVQSPVTDVKDLPGELRQALKDTTRPEGVGAVEIATFDISQIYSLDSRKPLSADTPVNPDATLDDPIMSQAGDVVATVRYNPTPSASLDMRAAYDVLYDDLRSVSLSANLRDARLGYARVSWFLNRDLGGTIVDPDPADPNNALQRRFADASQIRLIGGTGFLNRKVTLDLEGSYDIENRVLRDQRYRLGYNTQCCGMLVEVARRDFETIDEIEYRFVLNLRGVGTFLDLQGRPR